MIDKNMWKTASRLFISERAEMVSRRPSPEELCYVSAKDPRTWRAWCDAGTYSALVADLLNHAAAGPVSTVLEVGCAAGLLAQGIASRVRQYTGIDISRPALAVARSLSIPNAHFQFADAARLPFPHEAFDAVLCCDVFNNFPSFEDCASIIREMLRVTRAGGKVVIGAVPDLARKDAFTEALPEIDRKLDARYGPRDNNKSPSLRRPGIVARIRSLLAPTKPGFLNQYFSAEDFMRFGAENKVSTEIAELHSLHPFAGFRINVVYAKLPS
jgi:SAM-dependent methyltransferase